MTTIKQARDEVRGLGFTLRKTECGEFRLCPKGGTENQAYYTDCLDDAVGTARLEHARNPVGWFNPQSYGSKH